MKEWYFNRQIRTSHVQCYFNKKKIEYKNYFGKDSDFYISNLKNDLEAKYNVKLI